jgi:FMN phosphatase YigB (HAD superfamily)
MKDYQAHLEKLRKDAAECALVRDLATTKRSAKCSIGWHGIWIN